MKCACAGRRPRVSGLSGDENEVVRRTQGHLCNYRAGCGSEGAN